MIISKTPYRLTLAGGGTDLPAFYKKYGGYVITSTIDKYMHLIFKTPANPINKHEIILRYGKSETVLSVEEIKHDIIRNVLLTENFNKSVQIFSIGDIPAGSGLGSSSVFTVNLLHCLYTSQHRDTSKYRLATDACTYEMNILKKACGKQDQFAVAFGGINELAINKLGQVTVKQLNISINTIKTLECNMMMFYTGNSRLSHDLIKEQEIKIENNEIDDIMLKIKELAEKTVEHLVSGDCDLFGYSLREHWDLKKQISNNMSNKLIDDVNEIVIKSGAYGMKLCGAGGQGFLLVYAHSKRNRDLIRKKLKHLNLNELDWRFEQKGTHLILND